MVSRLVEPTGSEVHIDQHGEQRCHRRTTRVEFAQSPLEGVLGQRRVASRQLRDSTGTSRVEVALESLEQLLGLLVAALPGAQIGQADKRARPAANGGRDPTGAPPR